MIIQFIIGVSSQGGSLVKIAIPKERRGLERRVAATPDSVKKLAAMGFEVVVERGAGDASRYPDASYEEAGAALAEGPEAVLQGAGVVLKVQRPLLAGEGEVDELALMPRGALLIGALAPYANPEAVRAYAEAGVTALAMELVPRITRAQGMDIPSSQSNLAGYRAVIDAAQAYDRIMPMMMTAAGTLAPARVMVLGAGVAGLQAIATARRLGALVSATDVRPAAKEQVESLGGKFVMVESEETREAETAGGYAREMSEDYKRRQAELVAETLKKQDIAICTALIPGRRAPILITEAMARSMRPGSIIVDLAAEQGGNCELTRPGETVEVAGVRILGALNVPSSLSADASALYARNLVNFLAPIADKEGGGLKLDWNDEILKAVCLTRDGQVVNPAFGGQA